MNSYDPNVHPNLATQALTPELDIHFVETLPAYPFLPWPSGPLWAMMAMIGDALNPKVSTGGEWNKFWPTCEACR